MIKAKGLLSIISAAIRYHDRSECHRDTTGDSDTAEEIAKAGGQLGIENMLGTYC